MLRKIFMRNDLSKERFRNEWKYLISTSEKELLELRMKHLLKKAKRKLLKVFRRRLPEANCQKKRQKLLSARSQQVLEINVQTAI